MFNVQYEYISIKKHFYDLVKKIQCTLYFRLSYSIRSNDKRILPAVGLLSFAVGCSLSAAGQFLHELIIIIDRYGLIIFHWLTSYLYDF